MKTNWFDKNARNYKAARPRYPEALFDYLAARVPGHGLAVDCGAGNGQASLPLSRRFREVIGVDEGANQIDNAEKADNIKYIQSSVSHMPFIASQSADLVAAAAAVHWFDLEKFYGETDRILKPGGVLALWAYYMPQVTPEIDKIVKNFFEDTLGEYVNQRRRWIINGYDDLPFPKAYAPKEKKVFEYSIKGDFNRFAAVLESSSFVQRHIGKTGRNPFDDIRDNLKKIWGPEEAPRTLTWQHKMVIGAKPRAGFVP